VLNFALNWEKYLQMTNIINQLRITAIVLLFFALFNLVVIYRQIDSMSSDGRIVNYAGIVRGKTQRVIKLEISQQNTDNIISELDQVIKALINGDTKLNISKITTKIFRAK
jgi:methyl-accepting chemotaxis protein